MSTTTSFLYQSQSLTFRIQCSDSNPRRGFGTKKEIKTNKVSTSREEKGRRLQQSKSKTKKSTPSPTNQAPGLSSRLDGKSNISLDPQFEERLEAVRRAALEQKKEDENKEFGVIDYDAPVESDQKTIGLGTKIGIGVAVVAFGLVFAFGDFLPSDSVSPTEEAAVIKNRLSDEEKVTLQARLKQYEAMLNISPKDPTALEGAAVTLAELGEYTRASSLLEELTKEKQSDPDVFRLLGEVKYELKDYQGSINAYRSSAMASEKIDFEVLRGLANAYLAAKKPDEAVQFLLAYREQWNRETSNNLNDNAGGGTMKIGSQNVDPIQGGIGLRKHLSPDALRVELLLGKAYSDWGHISDAVSVYDGIISSHPNDFRGYLAKGIILKENGNIGDAERMFIQARFFASEKAKALVDRYTRR